MKIDAERLTRLARLQSQVLRLEFRNIELLATAFTHGPDAGTLEAGFPSDKTGTRLSGNARLAALGECLLRLIGLQEAYVDGSALAPADMKVGVVYS